MADNVEVCHKDETRPPVATISLPKVDLPKTKENPSIQKGKLISGRFRPEPWTEQPYRGKSISPWVVAKSGHSRMSAKLKRRRNIVYDMF